MALGIGMAQVRKQIHFAKVYGKAQMFGLLRPKDYICVIHSNESTK